MKFLLLAGLLAGLLALPATSFAQRQVRITDLTAIEEKGLSPEVVAAEFSANSVQNYPDQVISGNSPSLYMRGNSPYTVTAGSIPDSYTRGNFPNSYTIGRLLESLGPEGTMNEIPMPKMNLGQ